MNRFAPLFMGLLLSLSLSVPALAGNQVKEIAIKAQLHKDGSMDVTQRWEGSFSEGTELYIPLPKDLTLTAFRVSDEMGKYASTALWDVTASLAEKERRYGVLTTPDGYELCFGIGQYGARHFVIDYSVSDVVGGYGDSDGFSFRFVNAYMNTTPTKVALELSLGDGTAISEEMSKVWGFGFDGTVAIADGRVVAKTSNDISYTGHMTLLLSLEKGLLSPQRQEEESFETLQESVVANNGKAVGEGISITGRWLPALGVVVAGGLLFFLLRKKRRQRKKVEAFGVGGGYFKQIPNEGNRYATYVLGGLFDLCEPSSFLSLSLLRLIDLGCLQPIRERGGHWDAATEPIMLRILAKPGPRSDELDQHLYGILRSIGGSDGVLSQLNLTSMSPRYSQELSQYLKQCEEKGRGYLTRKHCLTSYEARGNLGSLTVNGKRELHEIFGFRSYLQDLEGLKEGAVPIWREYLSYGLLFGMADDLIHHLKTVSPHLVGEVDYYEPAVMMSASYAKEMCRQMQPGAAP